MSSLIHHHKYQTYHLKHEMHHPTDSMAWKCFQTMTKVACDQFVVMFRSLISLIFYKQVCIMTVVHIIQFFSILNLFFPSPSLGCFILNFFDFLPAAGFSLVLDEDLARGGGEVDAKLKRWPAGGRGGGEARGRRRGGSRIAWLFANR